MLANSEQLKLLATNIRVLSAEAVEKANSGHPGMPMGTADMAAVLWAQFLRFDNQDPEWINRDRFVLSAGHGSMLLYSLLHLFGYDVSLDQIKHFRQWGSITPGHPEFGLTPGVETTTGPLGQGLANGVGLALSGKMLAAKYGQEIFDYRVFGIVSDGDLMEGVASEAASMAGHLKLGNLVYLYDDNHISIGGNTNVCFTENVPQRFESYGWHVQSVDGHDMAAVAKAIESAVAEKSRPSIICARTTIAWGSPNKAGTADAHGSPLGKDELKSTKERLGWPTDKEFYIPDAVRGFCSELAGVKHADRSAWDKRFLAWQKSNPEKAKELAGQTAREIPTALATELWATLSKAGKDATRNLSGQALQIISKHVSSFIGGSADLEPSNKTLIKGGADISPENFAGKNIRFGVREHGMGAIANGLAYTRAWIPYTATFLVFADYMRPPIRLAALSHLQSLFIFTHDSFWVGEDGPTHEPVEQLASLRLIPNLYVFRPADGREVAAAYLSALALKNRPSTLLFTRQNLTPLAGDHDISLSEIQRGGYVVSGSATKELVLIGTGSEAGVAADTAKLLAERGIAARVVSIPCVEQFLEQDQSYRDSVIPPQAKKVLIEAGVFAGWEKIVGTAALPITLEHYGASAPGELLAEKFGFSPAIVRDRISAWLK